MEQKLTAYKKAKEERNAKIISRYKELRAEGYMKTIAYEELREEFGFYSSQGIAVIIRKAEKDGIIKSDRKNKVPKA